MNKQSVLVVDDEPDIRELLEMTLLRMGLEVACAADYSNATRLIRQRGFDFCLTDMRLPDGDGIALVEYIQHHRPQMPVAVITAHGNMELAIQAMKAGAYDFVSKPVSLEKLRSLVEHGLQTAGTALPAEDSTDSDFADGASPDDRYRIIGNSPQIRELRQAIKKFARSQAPVFIEGPSGTGKELVARQIHRQSARADAPFVAVNCGAIPSELMESELFGHVKGSFTGALSDNPGLFRSAEGGTLFLDEIADLPLPMQVKLLRVLQEKSIRPVGAQREITTDVRIISASHKNLTELVEQGRFRQDLYYRIHVIGIQTPPLQERREDIPLLAGHILARLSREQRRSLQIDDAALQRLREYPFPGNVRELENILERAAALADGDRIQADDLQLPEITATTQTRPSLTQQTREIEAEALRRALEANRWNQSAAARELGITLRQLRYRCEKFGLTKR